jgi:K+-sensing histidine kinase KdpD
MYQVPRQMAFPSKGQVKKVVCGRAGRKEAKWIGFGLAIVQSIARLHGGTTEVVIEVGRGTTITLAFAARSARGCDQPSDG